MTSSPIGADPVARPPVRHWPELAGSEDRAAGSGQVSPFDFNEIIVYDGERHSSDNPDGKTYTAGVLRFEPAAES